MVLTHLPGEFAKKNLQKLVEPFSGQCLHKNPLTGQVLVKYFAASISGCKISAFEVKACAESKISKGFWG